MAIGRDDVVAAATRLADEAGVDAVGMRALGRELGVTPMALYHHVGNLDALVDLMVEGVFAEVDLPRPGGNWRTELTRRSASLRRALGRHRWAIGLLDARTNPGPHRLAHHDAVLGTLRGAGFSLTATAHAFSLLDSYVLGFALQEATLPSAGDDVDPAQLAAALDPATHPHLAEFATGVVAELGYDFGAEFEVGLDLVLDAVAGLATGS